MVLPSKDAFISGESVRKAVYLDLADKHQNTTERFQFTDWSVDRITSVFRAKNVINSNKYLVGMVYLSHLSKEQLDNIINLIGYQYGTVWIALIEEGDLNDRDLSTLIYENFYDYFTLPLKNNLNYLRATLGHAYGISLLRAASGEETPPIEPSDMVGASDSMRQVFDQIRKVATTDAPVLLTGETGTGKGMVARAIHQRSSRCEGPFVAINCGALPDSLIHAELFGHEKGAFTGAHKRKIGRIEAANDGALFLDEVGDIPLDLQVYLLRFLEEKTIERLGSVDSINVNARIIAATNVDLDKAVEEGRFREDLYYRLNVLNIKLPTLSNRFEDIELLASYFFKKFSEGSQNKTHGFTKDALTAMNTHRWPGNIREMINRIRRALVMSDNRLITAADLGLSHYQVNPDIATLDQVRDQAEELAIRSALHYTNQNVTKASEILGVSRVTLYRLIEKYDLR